ncbi:cysteine-rich DPF motif domain-containing protein 1 isoform X2 [Poecilia reticulata]|uniref:cysteine-rich DPF motif domain-containing protein 1 isoform X2 n=1 Tax=Poecilia reticulata TaxID=8081 RepID=UPI0007EA934B|nr:PREDICTED: cysteine-rich DPF motif domain-containing protein 1 isoform X2 [Poecilia reticulata]
MEQTATETLQNTFNCQLCGLSTSYTYYGQKPPNTRAIVLLEECFVAKDPFSPDKEKFLVLGSACSLCNMCVCVGPVRHMNTCLIKRLQPVLHQEVLHAVRE